MSNLTALRQAVERLYTAGNAKADEWIDWSYPHHVLVVAQLTERLATTHHAQTNLAVAGALLHDIADAIMARATPEHEAESLKLAEQLLRDSRFSPDDTRFIIDEIIRPHSCHDLIPTTVEGKVMASADGAAHFLTDFYPLFCWRHYGPENNYEVFKTWALKKMEKNYHKKLFFDDIKREVTPRYEALKLIFS